MKKKIIYLIFFCTVIIIAYYIYNNKINEKENYYALASYVQIINKKAASLLIDDDKLSNVSSEILLKMAQDAKPEATEKLKKYKIKMKHDTDETIIILGDEKRLLLEDASRTGEFDHLYFESQEVRIFDFTMNLKN